MLRIPTGRQIEASRLNGAKSHGSKTPLGKKISSRNGFKQDRFARFPCLTDAGEDLVTTSTNCDWCVNRLITDDENDEIPPDPENGTQLPPNQLRNTSDDGKFEPENPSLKLPHSPIARRLYALASRRPRPKFRPRA